MVVVTGRMFQSVRRYLLLGGLHDPVVCYQGAVVAEPRTGRFLRHVPIPLGLARKAIAAVEAEGYQLNCYVDDELYVAEVTPEARRYADFQHLEIHTVGDLLGWLERPPTKLVVVGDPDRLEGLTFLAGQLGFSRERTIAFGDGENDVELLDWAGYGIAVENAHDRLLARADLVCPRAEDEGVAQVLEAFLGLRS